MTGERDTKRRRRGGGRAALVARRLSGTSAVLAPAYITRKIPAYELLTEAGLVKLEHHAEWILAEVGLEIRGDPIALGLFKEAGASVDGERVRFDRGHVRSLCESAPKTYTMHARTSLFK